MANEIDFIELMHEAYAQDEMTADEYLVEKLHNVFPYSLVFIKFDRGE
ncbi:MAG: hypothetical protein J6Y78_11145 [Paludibacteraceae bacterium]|nr:hypothetical protein [Paludibacteraceae bacterium]